MLLALLAVWVVTGAWLCLESVVGIPARLVYALVGGRHHGPHVLGQVGLMGAPVVWPRSSHPAITSALLAC